MRASDYDYHLPTHLIAQKPAQERHFSRLLVLQRAQHCLSHEQFWQFPKHLRPGDVLVLNDSKVIPARLRGVNPKSAGHFEILLLEENAPNDWWAMLRPGKRARVGTHINLVEHPTPVRPGPQKIHVRVEPEFHAPIHALVTAINSEGQRRLQFHGTKNILDSLDALGEMPLPPYIKREAPNDSPDDLERYQTIYAHAPGSVAAPTAGLHFTPALLDEIRGKGVHLCFVTLHVGPGTFAPVKVEDLAHHIMHEERYTMPDATADAINAAKRERRRVIPVGTTSVRVLESVGAAHDGTIVAGNGRTGIFIRPPFRFRIADALLTNFHLPRSTLLMLVSAFASPGHSSGRDIILDAYQQAIARAYRFFSYGDAMFIE